MNANSATSGKSGPNYQEDNEYSQCNRYHYKCLKIARGKVKEDDKYTCPICDWRMKIPRDAARPKLEDLNSLVDEIPTLPFQPEEEEILTRIIDNAQSFRNHLSQYSSSLVSTKAEAETQRFYLRKLEGAEVLLAYETNFFRQELHKFFPVAPEAPPISEVSLSTRKPRPTKLQKMLIEYGVDNPDDLPEHAKGKANSLRRKAANAEAAAVAAKMTTGPIVPPSGYGGPTFFPRASQSSPSANGDSRLSERPESQNGPPLHLGRLGAGGPQLVGSHSIMTLEERLMRDQDDIELHTEPGKSKALEILSRTEMGRQQARNIWGADIWGPSDHYMGDSKRSVSPTMDGMMKQDEGNVEQMFKDMTHQDDEDEMKKREVGSDRPMTTASLEKERNGLDALLDGE